MSATTEVDAGSRAAVAGLLFAGLYVVVFVVLSRIPDADTARSAAIEFYSSRNERRLAQFAGVYLVPVAGISLLWFTAAVRHRITALAASENALLSTVQLVSAAVYVAMVFTATAVLTAPVIGVEIGAVTPEDVVTERSLLVVGDSILVVFALRVGGVFIAAGTTRALRSGLIPRWFAFASYAVVLVLLLTVARLRAVSLLFPFWVAIMSIVVLIKRPAFRAGRSA